MLLWRLATIKWRAGCAERCTSGSERRGWEIVDYAQSLTLLKVKGAWRYLYRAVDKNGQTIDFLLTKRRKRMSAQSFLIKAIDNNGTPELINIDKSGSNKSAIKVYNKRSFTDIGIRQCKYLNNIVEQDHRFIKWRIQQGLGFKDFESAKRTIAGIEIVHMIKKNQLINPGITPFKSFCSLAS